MSKKNFTSPFVEKSWKMTIFVSSHVENFLNFVSQVEKWEL